MTMISAFIVDVQKFGENLEDKNKTQVTQISGAVFQGFNSKAIDAAKRPKEISND